MSCESKERKQPSFESSVKSSIARSPVAWLSVCFSSDPRRGFLVCDPLSLLLLSSLSLSLSPSHHFIQNSLPFVHSFHFSTASATSIFKMRKIREVELRSDTMTKPTPEMRAAMFTAQVGDDGYGEDPTVKELEEMGARMFGMEAARFFPTGIMGNLAAVMSHCWERGQEIILGDLSHIHLLEQGGIAHLANVHHRTVANYDDGTFSVEALEQMIRPTNDVHQPRTSLICIENTHNRCSGAVVPLDFVEEVARVAKNNNLKLHVDGARIFNAAVALDLPVSSLLQKCDSVSVCLSKGLGCPIGNLVAGSKEFIEKATRCRKVLGGSMRQTGIVASAGIVALNKMVNRMADDHTHARLLAEAINSSKSKVCSVDLKRVQTNIVLVKTNPEYSTCGQFCDRMRQVTDREADVLGEEDLCIVRMNPFLNFVRMVTHADVSSDDIRLVIRKLKYVIEEFERKPGQVINGH